MDSINQELSVGSWTGKLSRNEDLGLDVANIAAFITKWIFCVI